MKLYLNALTNGCWFLWVAILVSLGIDLILNGSVWIGFNGITFQVAVIILLYAGYRAKDLANEQNY